MFALPSPPPASSVSTEVLAPFVWMDPADAASTHPFVFSCRFSCVGGETAAGPLPVPVGNQLRSNEMLLVSDGFSSAV